MMTQQHSDNPNAGNFGGDMIEPMNQAFGEHVFYGLEYVLDEWQEQARPLAYRNNVGPFGFWDGRD